MFGQLKVDPVVPATPPEWAFDPQRVDKLYQPIYDRVNYAAAGATSVNFFSVPIGGSATLIRAGTAATITKTRRDTNLSNQGVLPNEGFDWQGVAICYIPLQQAVGAAATGDIIDDIDRIRYGGYFTFKVLDNTLLEGPLFLLPSIASMAGVVSTTETSHSIVSAQPGIGDPRAAFWVTEKKFLPPNTGFSFAMNWDGTVSVTQTFDIYIILLGMKYRPK